MRNTAIYRAISSVLVIFFNATLSDIISTLEHIMVPNKENLSETEVPDHSGAP